MDSESGGIRAKIHAAATEQTMYRMPCKKGYQTTPWHATVLTLTALG
jgi:hypothetical protein